jgi:hypothetical protein
LAFVQQSSQLAKSAAHAPASLQTSRQKRWAGNREKSVQDIRALRAAGVPEQLT